MAFCPIKIKVDEVLECQACAVEVINAESSAELFEVFKDLTGIKPIYDNAEIVFCKNCRSTLEAFQLFKNLCVHTQEIFACRQLCDGQEIEEEFIVGIELEEAIGSVDTLNEEIQYYVCDICQKQFKTKRGLRIHVSNLHLKIKRSTYSSQTKQDHDETVYECKDCSAKLSSMRNLKRHQATHNSEKGFKCTYCNSTFNSQQNQYYHERYVHKTGRQYVCSNCAYICYNPTVMNQHVKRHHSMLKFQCDQCPKECKTPGDLRDHKLVHENLEKTVPCPECGTLFKHMKSMRNHLRTVHKAERKYICETCSKGFVSKNGLDRHIVTHTGERQFACNFCTQAFTQMQALKRHLTTHTGVRPFACPYCSHTFAENFYMKKHASICAKNPHEASLPST